MLSLFTNLHFFRYQILAKESPEFQEPQYLPRDYTEKDWCVQLLYHPTKNKRSAPSGFCGNGRWEIQPRRYYDTLNVVIILKVWFTARNQKIVKKLKRNSCEKRNSVRRYRISTASVRCYILTLISLLLPTVTCL